MACDQKKKTRKERFLGDMHEVVALGGFARAHPGRFCSRPSWAHYPKTIFAAKAYADQGRKEQAVKVRYRGLAKNTAQFFTLANFHLIRSPSDAENTLTGNPNAAISFTT